MTPGTAPPEPRFPDGRPELEQPPWRQDFPIDRPQDHYIARRDYTKFMVLTSLAFVVGQLCIGLKSLMRRAKGQPPIRRIAQIDEIPVGGALSFHYPGKHDPCLLVRPNNETLLAYDQRCTHLACAIIPEVDHGRLHCPCHAGFFDLATGRPTAGPPRRPLPRILLEERDGIIYATGIELRTT
jgi:nitrite reductase/ring-hydroxylating ferredoxin subunit